MMVQLPSQGWQQALFRKHCVSATPVLWADMSFVSVTQQFAKLQASPKS